METAERSAKGFGSGRQTDQASPGTDPRAEQLRRDLEGCPTRQELAKLELQMGTDVKWVSVKYQIDLERCQRYVEALEKQREAERVRAAAITGDV